MEVQNIPEQLKSSYDALQAQKSIQGNVDEWLDCIESCLDVRELDRSIVAKLIDKIIVSEKVEHEGKSYTQDIIIQYRFVGNISDKNEEAPLSFLNDA
ncbi:MAG: DUF4368 domain-containing protein [Bacillota bacterium]|nr:DUF4368 domain-containing protein [Bacillota bacterium]